MKNKFIKIISVVIASAVSITLVTASVLATEDTTRPVTESRYDSIDISSITGEGGNPAELSSVASAIAAEKMWYEYIVYSPQPVASYRISDDRRLLFYDPYDYSNSMVMEVTGKDSDWSSANSVEVSYTFGSSAEMATGESSDVSTSREIQDGIDVNYGYTSGVSVSSSINWSKTFEQSLDVEAQTTISSSKTESSSQDFDIGVKKDILGFEVSAGYSNSGSSSETNGRETMIGTSIHNGYSKSIGGSIDFSSSESTNMGWSILANRVSTTTGSTFSTSKSWSTDESVTTTRSFDAAYFNESGAPLQWKIVQYQVQMPMKFDVQCLINGEWVSTDSDYCVLTTLQGTCRAWMQNTEAYIEHWGTGEPIIWDKFWSSFFTKDQLMTAYQNRLYPNS